MNSSKPIQAEPMPTENKTAEQASGIASADFWIGAANDESKRIADRLFAWREAVNHIRNGYYAEKERADKQSSEIGRLKRQVGALTQQAQDYSTAAHRQYGLKAEAEEKLSQQSSEIERLNARVEQLQADVLKAADWYMRAEDLTRDNIKLKTVLRTIESINGNPPIQVARKFAAAALKAFDKSLTSSPQNCGRERREMSQSTPRRKLFCQRCQQTHWGQLRHFNVDVVRQRGNGVECVCNNCGHVYVSYSSAAWRRLQNIQPKASRE